MERLEYFCHNGHSLLCEEVKVNNSASIKLLFATANKEGLVYLSPEQDKNIIKAETEFKDNELLRIMCPECKEELDNIAPCKCSNGSKFVALYLNRNRSFNDSVGLCNRWKCSNLYLQNTWKILSSC